MKLPSHSRLRDARFLILLYQKSCNYTQNSSKHCLSWQGWLSVKGPVTCFCWGADLNAEGLAWLPWQQWCISYFSWPLGNSLTLLQKGVRKNGPKGECLKIQELTGQHPWVTHQHLLWHLWKVSQKISPQKPSVFVRYCLLFLLSSCLPWLSLCYMEHAPLNSTIFHWMPELGVHLPFWSEKKFK